MNTTDNNDLDDRLGTGTQTVALSELADKPCRCGKPLHWYQYAETDYAECSCGMQYAAYPATVKVEGTDRNVL